MRADQRARRDAFLNRIGARPVVMGILNVTPDSFSDGGRFLDPAAAIAHAEEMIGEGADIIDIGAESSRPYGDPVAVTAEEERRRLEGVLPAVARLGHPVSIDTMKASVAAWTACSTFAEAAAPSSQSCWTSAASGATCAASSSMPFWPAPPAAW